MYPGSQPPFKRWWFLLDDDKPPLEKWWFVNRPIKDGGWTSRVGIYNPYEKINHLIFPRTLTVIVKSWQRQGVVLR